MRGYLAVAITGVAFLAVDLIQRTLIVVIIKVLPSQRNAVLYRWLKVCRDITLGYLSFIGGARFEIRAELDDFLQAASFVLKNRGTLTLIYLAARLGSVFQAVASTRLEIQRMRCVHSFLHSRASLVLVQARKNGKPGLECDPPLVLYQNEAGGQTRLSKQALTLCPFLGCNP